MATNPESNPTTMQQELGEMQNTSPSSQSMETTATPHIPQVKIEAGEDGAKEPRPTGEESGMNGGPYINGGSSTLPGTTHPSTDAVIEETSGADEAIPDLASGSLSQRADVVSFASLPTETKKSPKPDNAEPSLESAVLQNNVSKPVESLKSPAALPQDSDLPSLPRARLPQDRIGLLSDRIKDDPRGDTEAWLALVQEHRSHNRLEDARKTYDAFFKVFPRATEQWIAYAKMELDHDHFKKAEEIFSRTVTDIPNVQLCTTYLDYVRRRYPTTTDNGRSIVTEAFKAILKIVGKDKDSGPLWQDYLAFLRTTPGNVTGTGWQDQQKKDAVRGAYQQAVCIPHSSVAAMWTEYNKFEREIDRTKFQAMMRMKSADFTQARIARTTLENIARDLDSATVPRLPPAFGFAGDTEYTKQVDTWKRLIEWEKSDPLIFKRDQPGEWRARVLYAYKQALVPLFFWPEMWFSAVEFCLSQGLEADADKFLAGGTAANPESCLLAFQMAERIESNSKDNGTDEAKKQRGDTVRKPYDDVLNALYDLITKTNDRKRNTLTLIREDFAKQQQQEISSRPPSRDQDDDEFGAEKKEGDNSRSSPEARLALHVEAVERGFTAQVNTLKKTISFVWTALLRAMRRVQGKGVPSGTVRGVRGVFTDARKRGQLTSDFYTALALVEHYSFEDPIGTKVFERGWKLFPEDVEYAVSYIKHLLEIRDATNARATFEIMVSATRLGKTPALLATAKPLFVFWHQYESHYGDLPQLKNLEQRMREAFPEDPELALFSRRHSAPGFDPCAIRPLISQKAQATPKLLPVIEQPPPSSAVHSPAPRPGLSLATANNSPKRPFDESDSESGPPRKFLRGESPSLKGAAGRRLDAAKNRSMGRTEANTAGTHPQTTSNARKHPIPQPIYRMLNILPPTMASRGLPPIPEDLILRLLRGADLSKEGVDRLVAAHPAGLPPKPPPLQGIPPVHQTPHPPQQNYGGYSQPNYGQYGNNQYGYGQPNGQQPSYGYGR